MDWKKCNGCILVVAPIITINYKLLLVHLQNISEYDWVNTTKAEGRAEQRKYRLTTAWFYSRFKKIMFSISARFFSTVYFVPKYFKKIASSEERRVATWENYYRFMMSVSVTNDNCIMFNDIPMSASGDHIQYDVWPTYHNLISIIPWIIYIHIYIYIYIYIYISE